MCQDRLFSPGREGGVPPPPSPRDSERDRRRRSAALPRLRPYERITIDALAAGHHPATCKILSMDGNRIELEDQIRKTIKDSALATAVLQIFDRETKAR